MSRITLFALLIMAVMSVRAGGSERTLVDFGDKNASEGWQAVNDGVMGGRSLGRFKINTEKHLEFYGVLSLENNGGFASLRARLPQLRLQTGDRLVMRVRGDGRKYAFNLYTQANLGGYSYRQSFQTQKDEWIEVEFEIDRFAATWRGRNFPNERLVASKVAGLGLLLGDKKPGQFKLEVDWIKVRDAKHKVIPKPPVTLKPPAATVKDPASDGENQT